MTYREEFTRSSRPHILMLTTHGVHQWGVVPGLTDTGGQNVFVNQFTGELVRQGFRVTIANRGGYPHPLTGEPQVGVDYKDSHQRILYLEDGLDQFVRKEDMGEQVPGLAESLASFLQSEDQHIDLIISHYWDAAAVGILFQEQTGGRLPHVWVPHSLGAIKKRNVDRGQWESLRIDERVNAEQGIIRKVNRVASTSPLITTVLQNDYDYPDPPLWLPPCVSPDRYFPHDVARKAQVWSEISKASGLPVSEIQQMKIITEISRTDTTKRKDVLIKAFAQTLRQHPDALLLVTIERHKKELAGTLLGLIDDLGIRNHTAVLGSVWDILPDIYAVSQIYCTPSIMEGFGMSAQEAAATAVPVVASSLVPFAEHYLHGAPAELNLSASRPYSVGEGAVVVQPDHVAGFAAALNLLLSDQALRKRIGRRAYQITIPHFTWPRVVQQFLQELSKVSG